MDVVTEVLIDEAGLFHTFVSFHRQRFPQCYFSCLSNIPVSVPNHLVCPRTSLSPPGKHLLVSLPSDTHYMAWSLLGVGAGVSSGRKDLGH